MVEQKPLPFQISIILDGKKIETSISHKDDMDLIFKAFIQSLIDSGYKTEDIHTSINKINKKL